MRLVWFLTALSLASAQTPPPEDSRNTDIPHTDTHFVPSFLAACVSRHAGAMGEAENFFAGKFYPREDSTRCRRKRR